MHFDIVHRKTSSLDWTEVITCPHCGHVAKGRVHVSAEGRGNAHYGLFNDDAKERAGVDAFANASSKGEELLRRAKCAACGKRAAGAGGAILSASGLGFLMAVFGFSTLGGGSLVLGVLMAIVLSPLFAWWGAREADRTVSWEEVLVNVPEHFVNPMASRAPVAVRPLVVSPPPEPEHVMAPRWETPDLPNQPKLDAGGDGELELDLDRSWNKNG
jgi:DNA-directed RNA polymerase subunit RPC12/RpoP